MSASLAAPLRMNRAFDASPAAFSVGSTSDARAHIAICQRSGVIDRVFIYSRAVAGAGTVIGARIETVSGGNPTGTLVSAGASGLWTHDGVVGAKTITLTSPVTVTAGDIIAVILYCDTYVASASLASTISSGYTVLLDSPGLPGLKTSTTFVVGSGAGWTTGTAPVVIAFAAVYTDGEPLLGSVVPGATTTSPTSVVPSGANSYLGLKFTPDSTCDLHYVTWFGNNSGNSYWQVYDSVSNTLIGTSAYIPSGANPSSTINTMCLFSSPVRLNGGQSYRLVQRNVSGTTTQVSLALKDNEMLTKVFGAWCRTTSSDGLNWTDDNTGICPNVMPHVVPVRDGLRTPRAMNGGFSA